MAMQTINIGTAAGAGDGEGLRDALIKVNSNFDEVYDGVAQLGIDKVDLGPIATSGLTMTAGLLGRSTGATQAPIGILSDVQVKTFLGLENVTNTSDALKPISTATQTALDTKADITHTHVIADVTGLQTTLNGKADSSHSHAPANIQLSSGPRLLGKTSPGAGPADELTDVDVRTFLSINNVNNTSDALKPISNAVQAALNLKLDASGTITISQVTSLQSALDNRALASHPHPISQITGLQSELDAKASISSVVVGYSGNGDGNDVEFPLQPSLSSFTINITNSRARAVNPAPNAQTREIEKNGVVIGTITWTTGSSLGVISIPNSLDRNIDLGDFLAITATGQTPWSTNLTIILRN